MSANPIDPFDPAELLDVIVAIVREHNQHIVSEFKRCANSSAGSKPIPEAYFQLPIAPSSQTAPFTPPIGHVSTAKPIEDSWWVEQDRDTAWARHWEEQDLDPIDPKSWK